MYDKQNVKETLKLTLQLYSGSLIKDWGTQSN